MRILIDLQACQSSGSRTRGIGRYSLSLAKAMARQAGKHELHLMLNENFSDSIDDLRKEFSGLVPHSHIHTWSALRSVSAATPDNLRRRAASELVREEAFAQIRPDVIHVSSLFEGLGDDALTNVHSLNSTPTAVTLYDLIPLIHRQQYLVDSVISRWYYQKIQALKNADLLLAISNSSRQEALTYLQLPPEKVVNISSAVDERFVLNDYASEVIAALLARYRLTRPFVMYTGGIDLRKNIEKLIGAYARLPMAIRAQHQLAIVCSVHDADRQRLLKLAQSEGLAKDEVVLTGYVSDEELPMLYRHCRLFVFPSWHEGFGLPALEAMSCGAPVIAANTSSLPEVLERADAMFDPFQESSITEKMQTALCDEAFRRELSAHGLIQAKKFSWDASARTAIEAFEAQYEVKQSQQKIQLSNLPMLSKPKLAYVSPLPPQQSGIADYSAELLPELARYYDIHVISDQDKISDPWISANFPLHSVAWFRQNAAQFARIVYHFGNSQFHSHMFDLLEAHPGVLVLHDFYLSNIVSHLDHTGMKPNFWAQTLYDAHGFSALAKNAKSKSVHEVIWQFPCSSGVIDNAKGVIAHSTFSIGLAEKWYGKTCAESWTYIPHLRCLPQAFDSAQAKQALGFKESDFLVCAFGMLGPTKSNHRLLDAWLQSDLAHNSNCYLVFVGENDGGDYGKKIKDDIAQSVCSKRIRITGFAEATQFRQFLQAADLAVQLRTMSRGETSGTVLDCMAHGVTTIVNANGTMAELPAHALMQLPDEFSDLQLVDALHTAFNDPVHRQALGKKAVAHIVDHHQTFQIGQRYHQAIEKYYTIQPVDYRDALHQKLASQAADLSLSDLELMNLAKAIAANTRPRGKRLLVDVSRLAEVDAKSGIQRVVRAIVSALITHDLYAGRVEPVIVSPQGLRFARQFTSTFLGFPSLRGDNELLEVGVDDVFLGLDLHFETIIENPQVFETMRHRGVQIFFVVYDLLPILSPSFFEAQLAVNFTQWLTTMVNNANGAICISKSVQTELRTWIKAQLPDRIDDCQVQYFHLGADFQDSSKPLTASVFDQNLEQAFANQTCFLMVGTIEPRKGHAQSLDAFDALWKSGSEVCLIIVGGHGWKTEELRSRIASHPELNRRLFCFTDADDAVLTNLYRRSDCLLMASFGEGFGLPLIEAAQHQLPIVARRLPVFEEVAGENAYYFEGAEFQSLAECLQNWLQLHQNGAIPNSSRISWLHWTESAKALSQSITKMTRS